MKKKHILVVGGAGFIGSYINKLLHRKGYETTIVDNLCTGHRDSVCYGTFVEGDLASYSLLNQIFKNHSIDAVMHFAAHINVSESVKNPAKYYINNVSNTVNLLNAMISNDVKTFIFSSSAAVYGNPIEFPITEKHPCKPLSPYGESKKMVEKILADFDQSYGLKYCSLRYFNAAGGDPEGEIKNFQKISNNLIPRILTNMKQGDLQAAIYGKDYQTRDGTCIRDYIHIDDLGEAHIAALDKLFSGSGSNCFNLGNGKGYTVLEVVDTVEKVLNYKLKKTYYDRRLGDPPILLADFAKAHKHLNWKPKYTLEEMIEHAWTSYTKF